MSRVTLVCVLVFRSKEGGARDFEVSCSYIFLYDPFHKLNNVFVLCLVYNFVVEGNALEAILVMSSPKVTEDSLSHS